MRRAVESEPDRTPGRSGVRSVVLAACWLVLCLLTPEVGRAQGRSGQLLEVYRREHRERQEEFADSLQELARFCDEKGLAEASAEIRKLAEPPLPQSLRAEPLPKQVRERIPLDLPPDERYWRSQLRRLQEQYAKDLYVLSRKVLYAGSPSYAYDLVREVARHDPDHRSARRLLGYVRYGQQWVTPFAASQLRRHQVWHEQFGWLPKSYVEKYEKGLRFFQGRWMTAAQEAEIRRDFNHAWQIRTDHFLVKTNHSLQRGVEVAQALEDFYSYFFQTFAAFFNTPEQMQKLFNGNGSSGTRVNRPHLVHYYRDRDEYNRRLIKKIPQIAITNGLYYTADRTCYFYHDPDRSNERTLFHEATHQLFYESSSKQRPIAVNSDFWIVEGIACYMESFNRGPGRLSLGDPRYVRFRAARHRYLADGYYVPLQKLVLMGMEEFQSDPNISKNYSQASGLAHFFMHYDDGRYRDALIQHLSDIYSPDERRSARPRSLAELTRTEWRELDRQYGQYVRYLEDALDQISEPTSSQR